MIFIISKLLGESVKQMFYLGMSVIVIDCFLLTREFRILNGRHTENPNDKITF